MSQHSTQTEPNALLDTEEERVRQEEMRALEEMLSAATMFVSGLRKLMEAKGRVFKEKGRG